MKKLREELFTGKGRFATPVMGKGAVFLIHGVPGTRRETTMWWKKGHFTKTVIQRLLST